MSRTVLTEVEGFTPLIDSIVSDLGVMQAAVFGRVWRYCQMENQICYAAVETLAEELNLSPNCISGHLKELVSADYLTEVKRSGKTTVYKDTGKAALSMKITANLPPQNLGRSQAIPPQNLGTTPPEFGEVPPQNLGTKIESKIGKKKEKDIADPRSQSPAILAVRTVMARYPNKTLYDRIIEMVGDKPDIIRLQCCYTDWVARGYNPNAITWLEWYKSGVIPSRNGSSNNRSTPFRGNPVPPKTALSPELIAQGRAQLAEAEREKQERLRREREAPINQGYAIEEMP